MGFNCDFCYTFSLFEFCRIAPTAASIRERGLYLSAAFVGRQLAVGATSSTNLNRIRIEQRSSQDCLVCRVASGRRQLHTKPKRVSLSKLRTCFLKQKSCKSCNKSWVYNEKLSLCLSNSASI